MRARRCRVRLRNPGRQGWSAVADPVGDPGEQVVIGAGGTHVVLAAGPYRGGPQWPPSDARIIRCQGDPDDSARTNAVLLQNRPSTREGPAAQQCAHGFGLGVGFAPGRRLTISRPSYLRRAPMAWCRTRSRSGALLARSSRDNRSSPATARSVSLSTLRLSSPAAPSASVSVRRSFSAIWRGCSRHQPRGPTGLPVPPDAWSSSCAVRRVGRSSASGPHRLRAASGHRRSRPTFRQHSCAPRWARSIWHSRYCSPQWCGTERARGCRESAV